MGRGKRAQRATWKPGRCWPRAPRQHRQEGVPIHEGDSVMTHNRDHFPPDPTAVPSELAQALDTAPRRSSVAPGELRLDPEFQAAIPPLLAEEVEQLERNVVADGCREPLVVWAETQLL